MKKIITINREFGAGGSEIGRMVALALDFHYYDKEIILQTSEHSDIDPQSVAEWDETLPMTLGFAQSLFNFYSRPLSEKLFEAQKGAIRGIAELTNVMDRGVVIIGRSSNIILREYGRALHVFLTADIGWRLARMDNSLGYISEARRMGEVKKIDRARRRHCRYHTGTAFGGAENYDICLSVSRIGIERAADIICGLAREI